MLEINMEYARGLLFIRLNGILSKRTTNDLKTTLDRMIEKEGVKYFVINLEHLEYIDEEGLQLLMNYSINISLHEGKLIICGYHQKIQKKVSKDTEEAFQNIENSEDELTALRLIHI